MLAGRRTESAISGRGRTSLGQEKPLSGRFKVFGRAQSKLLTVPNGTESILATRISHVVPVRLAQPDESRTALCMRQGNI
jgi:hypothetical protein